jgi:uncharacterized protein YjbJ (UPF0337 family)
MQWETVRGNWNQWKGKVRERWGELTDDDIAKINGKRDQLVGRLQEIYGKSKDEAEDEINSFLRT